MTAQTLPVKNIIFDLGGVIINLHFDRMDAAFAELGIADLKAWLAVAENKLMFRQYETGKITTRDFAACIRASSAKAPDDDEIAAALNAMIGDLPAERIALLDSLKGKYRLFLFSNINDIHHRHIHGIYREQYARSFDEHFEKAYYSHLIGRRKPDTESFLHVINDAGISAAETLFIDDLLKNVTGASLAGLQAIHLGPGQTILDLDL